MLPALGKRHRVRVPLQKFRPEFLLQAADLLGESALGDEQGTGGFRKVEGFRRFDKVLQLS